MVLHHGNLVRSTKGLEIEMGAISNDIFAVQIDRRCK